MEPHVARHGLLERLDSADDLVVSNDACRLLCEEIDLYGRNDRQQRRERDPSLAHSLVVPSENCPDVLIAFGVWRFAGQAEARGRDLNPFTFLEDRKSTLL